MKLVSGLLGISILGSIPLACSSDDGRGPENGETGAACEAATDCYPDLPDGTLQGDAICMDRVEGGYCTHECVTDDDCCAAEGECPTDRAQVCSPFESTGLMMCLLSCEKTDVESDPDAVDDNDYCERNAGPAFSCRSSGGGSDNRKVCMPKDDCTATAGGAGGTCP
ncbi:MAG TPA: hypothetical protein VLC09_06535 [Polyangiaceae bacterium]|nr:hypothetical protein [Polyangiaceae bacterium]